MELREAFETVMMGTENIALATCTGDKPNVRVVTFGYEKQNAKIVYFTTFQGNQKIAEFEHNPNVTFLPLPESADTPAQVRIHGTVHKSARSLTEIAPMIIQKAPDFAELVKQAAPMLEVYEIHFDQAEVTIGMEPAQAFML